MIRAKHALVLGLGLASAGAGCGETAGQSAPQPRDTMSSAAHKRELEALHQQVLASQHQTSRSSYGKLPAYLVHRQGNPDRVLLATAGHPARTTQGAGVRLRLPGGRATATATGPAIPKRIMGTDVETTSGRFDVTFTGLRGKVPLRSRLFGIVDEHGTTHIPPVAITRRGSTARVSVRAVLPTGDGKIVYAPTGRPLVTWDYTLETY